MKTSQSSYNYSLIFLLALGSFTYGFNSSIIATVLGLSSYYEYFNLSTTGPRSGYANNIIGATNGVYAGGGIIGCFIGAALANALGRKPTVQIVCAVCIVSAVLQAAAVHIAMLLVGRCLNGIGVGMMQVVVPTYQSEIAPAYRRGRMVGSHGFLIVVGYSAAAWTGLGCYFETNPHIQWRLPLALQVVAPALLLLGTPWIPESPRWLAQNGKDAQALSILQKLHGSLKDNGHDFAGAEFLQIRRQLELDAKMPRGIIAMIQVPSYRKRFLCGLFVQCLAQSTGALVITNYQILIYKSLGITGWLALLLFGVYSSWAAFLNWAGSMVVDLVGRIRMLTFGIVCCALCVACEAAMVATYAGTSNRVGNGFGVFFVFLFITFYAFCVDAVSYIYVAEIFPTALRAQGVGLSIAGLFAMTLIYTQSAPTAFSHIGWRYYLVFVVVPLCGAPVMAYFLPEPKRLTLEEVGMLFGDEVADTTPSETSLGRLQEQGSRDGTEKAALTS